MGGFIIDTSLFLKFLIGGSLNVKILNYLGGIQILPEHAMYRYFGIYTYVALLALGSTFLNLHW